MIVKSDSYVRRKLRELKVINNQPWSIPIQHARISTQVATIPDLQEVKCCFSHDALLFLAASVNILPSFFVFRMKDRNNERDLILMV